MGMEDLSQIGNLTAKSNTHEHTSHDRFFSYANFTADPLMFASKTLGSLTLLNPPPGKQGAMHDSQCPTIRTLLKRATKEGCDEVRVMVSVPRVFVPNMGGLALRSA